MKKLVVLAAIVVMTVVDAMAQYGIKFGELEVDATNASDIFGDGKVSYDPALNVLMLHEGFEYNLSKNFVTINTGCDFGIRLVGDAEIVASVDCSDNLYIEATGSHTLKITSNISGSALTCPNLTVGNGVTLELLSRNSQADMYALDCGDLLTVNGGNLKAEVTTANMAVATQCMTLEGCWMQKPRGGFVGSIAGGICYGDGIPAKVVNITVTGFSVGENQGDGFSQGVLKLVENGKVVIIKDGKRFNLKGQRIQ